MLVKKKYIVAIVSLVVILFIIGGIIISLFQKDNSNSKNSIKIRYAYSYNIATADSLNELAREEGEDNYIEILEINITDAKKLEKLNNLLRNWKYKDYSSTIALEIYGEYEVTLENGIVLSVDSTDSFAYYTNGSESYLTKIPLEFSKTITEIVEQEVGN